MQDGRFLYSLMANATDIINSAKSILLTPLSYIYGAVVYARNKLFDWNAIKSEKFGIPVVSIGNIAVGGTGKTPHTEYIISLLKNKYNIGMISRGYKRKTSGFVIATPYTSPYDIGDEPYQIYQKFRGAISVAVCESRVEGIKKMLEANPGINLILLDDAFQHRYVKPSLSIILTEYSRPFFSDRLLPLGRLRETGQSVRERADFIIVTKCPEEINPIDLRLFKKQLDLFPFQKLFFSKYRYDNLTPVFPEESQYIPMLEILTEKDTILTITGIANPLPLIKYLKGFHATVRLMQYPDHHSFSRSDIDEIQSAFHSLKGRYKIIMTTEKDAVRIANNPYFPLDLKKHIFYQPINVVFKADENDVFDTEIQKALTKNGL